MFTLFEDTKVDKKKKNKLLIKLINFQKLKKSFSAALEGIKLLLKEQTFRIFSFIALIVVILMILFKIPIEQKLILILTITFLFSLELINSQIEKVLDIIDLKYSLKVKIIKDTTAGAILIASIGALVIGIFIFLPHILKLFL